MVDAQTRDIPVTVVVPVKNEEANITACLNALKRFVSVLVVDSASTDQTVSLAESLGATVIQFEWNGQFPKKRNWVLQNHTFETDWVIFIDADEMVDDAFCDALKAEIAQSSHSGFWINYTNYFMGRRLRFGVPQRKLACFKTGAGAYERIEEDNWSSLDMEVHEHPILSGSIGEIKAPIDHRDFRGVARFLERHVDYAKWESSRYLHLRDSLKSGEVALTFRQKIKYGSIAQFWFASLYFLYTYIGKLGILDGRAGYQYASYKKWYFQTVRNLIREQG